MQIALPMVWQGGNPKSPWVSLESKWMIRRFWVILPVGNHWKQDLYWVETPNWYPEMIHPTRFSWSWSNSWSQAFGGAGKALMSGRNPKSICIHLSLFHSYPDSYPCNMIKSWLSGFQKKEFLPVAMFQHVRVDINYTSTSSESSLQNIMLIRQQGKNLAHNFEKKQLEMTCTTYPAPSIHIFNGSTPRTIIRTSMVKGAEAHMVFPATIVYVYNDPADQADRYFTR